tara:strand:+ start:122 stop:451 length:330 start_codon:yes stop_codon:yes gene_type:complete
MIKLKKLIKEGTPGFEGRKFGDSLPTLQSIMQNHNSDKEEVKEEESLVESNIKVLKSNRIDSKTWRQMKYDLRDQFDELVDIGEDYGVFQNAQGTHKMLKQIKRIMDKI